MDNHSYKLECNCASKEHQRQQVNNRFCIECYSKRRNIIKQFSNGQVQNSVGFIIPQQKSQLNRESQKIDSQLEQLENFKEKIIKELFNIQETLRQDQNNIKTRLLQLDMISDKNIKDIKVNDYKNQCIEQLVDNHQFFKHHLNQDSNVKCLLNTLDDLHLSLLNIYQNLSYQMIKKLQQIENDSNDSSSTSKQKENYDLVSTVKHKDQISAAQISPKKKFLASSSEDVIIIWDILRDYNYFEYTSKSIIISLCFSNCENYLYFGDQMGRIGTINLNTLKLQFMKIHKNLTFHIVEKQVNQLISWSPGHKKKFTISDQKNQKIILEIQHSCAEPRNFDYSDKNNSIIGSDFSNELCIWDAQTGQKIIKDDQIFTQVGYIMVCLNTEQNKIIATKGSEIKIIRINFQERNLMILTSINDGYDEIQNISWVKNDEYYLCSYERYLNLHKINDHYNFIQYPISNDGYLLGKQTPDLEYLVTIGKDSVLLYLMY